MSITVEKLERIVAHCGRMRLVETELPGHYTLMRAGNIDSFLGQIDNQEMRDMFELFGDVITYLDTAQPPVSEVA